MARNLTIDPAFVRMLIDKAEVALVVTRDLEEDDLVSETDLDPATSEETHGAAHLSDEEMENRSYDEVTELIDDLNEDEAAELVALAWIGRGDGDASDFGEFVRTAKERRETKTSAYLLAMPLLPSFLEAGLEAMEEELDEEADEDEEEGLSDRD